MKQTLIYGENIEQILFYIACKIGYVTLNNIFWVTEKTVIFIWNTELVLFYIYM